MTSDEKKLSESVITKIEPLAGSTLRDEYAELSWDTLEGIDNHLTRGRINGDAIDAILCGDLFRAFAHMDRVRQRELPLIVMYLINRCPARSYGSDSRVSAWRAVEQNVRDRIMSHSPHTKYMAQRRAALMANDE